MPKRRNEPKEWSPTSLVRAPKEDTPPTLCAPWQYILSNPASYSPEIFANTALQFIFHPERNSKNIRRADILSNTTTDPGLPPSLVMIDRKICSQVIRRRLMPRNPNLDPELEQTCRLYVAEEETSASLVTYHCHYVEGAGVPYYVPDILGIAFELYEGNIYVAYLPLPEKECTNDRLQRVALNLLRTIHRHWFFLNVCLLIKSWSGGRIQETCPP